MTAELVQPDAREYKDYPGSNVSETNQGKRPGDTSLRTAKSSTLKQ